MTTQVSKSVIVNVPVSRAYNQWTQFEEFPQFMGGVQKVRQLSDDRLEWVAQIFGVKRQWEAKILEQRPDQKVAWAATSVWLAPSHPIGVPLAGDGGGHCFGLPTA